MGNFNNTYNLIKVYNDLKQSDSDNDKPGNKSRISKKLVKAKKYPDIKNTDKHFNKDTNLHFTASNQTLSVKA